MPTCLFCKREDVPRIPLTPIAASVLVAHVDMDGEPCLEGTSPEVHAQMLGDYPHIELLDDDTAWMIENEIAVAVDVQPADPIAQVAAAVAREDAEMPPSLPDVEPGAAPESDPVYDGEPIVRTKSDRRRRKRTL